MRFEVSNSSGVSIDDRELARLRMEAWHDRVEDRHVADIAVKVVQSSGASQNATIADLSGEGLRLEGLAGLAIGEHVLVILPDHRVLEITVRWAFGDQAGARIVHD